MKLSIAACLLASLLGLSAAPPAIAQDSPRARALQLEQQGQFAEAEDAWHSVLEQTPHNAEALAHLGLLEARQEHYDDAIGYYRKALAINPALPGVQLDLGLALFKAGRFKEAAAIFKSELKRHPGDQRLTILTGMSYFGMDSYAQAIPYLKDATAKDPQNLSLRLTLAHSCLWSKQYPCVLEVYKEILSLNADSAEADMLSGEAMDGLNNTSGAVEQFRAAEKANSNEPNVHFGLGFLLWKEKQYDEAAKEFQAELDNNPQNAKARAYLADVYINQDNNAAAEPELKQSIAIDPSFAFAWLDLGIVYAASGRNDEAGTAFKKAIELDPEDVNPHWRLARVYQAMGKADEAKAELNEVAAIKKKQDQGPNKPVLTLR